MDKKKEIKLSEDEKILISSIGYGFGATCLLMIPLGFIIWFSKAWLIWFCIIWFCSTVVNYNISLISKGKF